MSLLKKISTFVKSYRMKHVQTADEKQKYEHITIEEAQKRYAAEKDNYIWLDVRTQTEYNQGHIPGSKLIPVDQLEERTAEVGPKEKNIMVFCAAGGRSVAACMILHEKGFKHLTNMPGMNTWNGPTE